MSKNIEIQTGGKQGKLAIKQFSFDMFDPNPSIVMIAKRRSGKSWIVRALMNYFRNIPVGCIICPSDNVNPFYSKFFPPSYIFYQYKTEIVEAIFARQEIIKQKAEQKLKMGKKVDTRCFIIMDDCLASKGSWIKDQQLRNIFFNGRHSDIMYVLTMQFPLGITPELRANFDYIFLLAEDFVSNKKRIYDHYAGMFPNFESFRQVFDQLTSDFGAMVIVNSGTRASFLEKVFWYRAPDLSTLQIEFGCKQFRDYHANNYNPSWMKSSKVVDADEYMRKKKENKGKIIIDKQKK
jgi:hypothetical protein